MQVKEFAQYCFQVIDPETNEKLGPNMKGEIMIKGDCVMIGYHNNPVETANVWDDEGFLHTGDVGYIDEDECFYVVDRIKDMMKYQAWHVSTRMRIYPENYLEFEEEYSESPLE